MDRFTAFFLVLTVSNWIKPVRLFTTLPSFPICNIPNRQQAIGDTFQIVVSSSRHVNDNGEPISDLHSTLTPIDGNSILFYHNDTDLNDDEAGASVTYWSDIMRQDAWLEKQTTRVNATNRDNTDTSSSLISTLKLDDDLLTTSDLEQLEEYWDRLMPTVSYLGTVQVAKIFKALRVAYQAHRGQMRKSGEPFIVHVRGL